MRRSSHPNSKPRSAPPSTPATEPVSPRFLVHVVPGLEEVAGDEIAELLPNARRTGVWERFDARTSLLEYSGGNPRSWLALETAEDVFALAARARAVRSDHGGLAQLAAATLTSKQLDGALRAFAACRRGGASNPVPRTFRVITRKSGEHTFRRVDAGRAVEGAIRSRLPALRSVEDDADAEFWLTLVGDTALVGLRLSKRGMRAQSYPFVSLPASLKPTIARAMVRLSRPRPEDRVLDPCCGAGTLLIERARAATFDALLGGDRDPSAVGTARTNARAADVPVEIRQWDALQLPLPAADVDVVLTNPPFGKKVEIRGDPNTFYQRLVDEIGRVLRPGGRVVLLTSQTDAFLRAARDLPAPLTIRRRIPLLVRGERATLFVADAGGKESSE